MICATGFSASHWFSGAGTFESENTTPDRNITTESTCSITKRTSGSNGTIAEIMKPMPAANTNTTRNNGGSAK